MQHPREARQTQEGHNIPPREGQHNLDILRGAETEAESSRARGHGSQLAPEEEGNGATLGGRVGNKELHHPQPRIKISVNTDISVIGFYGNIGNIGNIGKISVDIFTKISVINFFLYFNYIDYEK